MGIWQHFLPLIQLYDPQVECLRLYESYDVQINKSGGTNTHLSAQHEDLCAYCGLLVLQGIRRATISSYAGH